jgi:ribosomal protein S18 acetylase RimI-like enzyme
MKVEIRRVESPKELKAFVRFPYSIYKGDPCWVPPLDMDDLTTLRKDKNPAFEYCEAEYWMAFMDGKAVGRIAGIINNRVIEKWGRKYARFGWIDFIEDFEVASALVKTVEDWAKSKGLEGICGPLGFTDLDKEGMLIEGFDRLGTYATGYNRPYYPRYLERLGYSKDVDWIEFRIKTPDRIPEKVQRVQELITKRTGVRLYEWKDKKDLVVKYGHQLFELIDEAYKELYGTCPLSEAQMQFYIKTYLGFVDARFTKVLVDEKGGLVGFGVAMPSLSRAAQKAGGRLLPFGALHFLLALRKPEVIDMYLVAVKPEYQERGVVAIIMNALNKSAIDAGVKYSETNVELETNVKVQSMWKDYEKVQHKRRRAFVKKF